MKKKLVEVIQYLSKGTTGNFEYGTTGTGQQTRLCIKFWRTLLPEAISSQCRSLQRLAIGEAFQRYG